jgi:lysophospholipase L1-like esterase
MNQRAIVRLASTTLVLAVTLTAAAAEPFFERLQVAPGQAGLQCYTSLAKLADGTLITPYSLDLQTCWVVMSTDHGKTWSEPKKVFTNPTGGYACDPDTFVLGNTVGVLETRVPPPFPPYTRSETWGVFSEDGGKTWGEPLQVSTPHRYLVGKIHTIITLDDGTLLMPAAYDTQMEQGKPVSDEGTMVIASGVLVSRDRGRTWTDQGPFVTGKPPHIGGTDGMDEPATVKLPSGQLFMVARTGDVHPWESRSSDLGKTWSEPTASPLTGNNAPCAMAVLKNGWLVIVWDNSVNQRAPLCAAISKDDGHTWSRPRVISSSYAEYPSVIQADDGTLVATYNAPAAGHPERLRVHAARFNAEWVMEAAEMPSVAFVGGSMTIAARPGVPAEATFVNRLQRLADERGAKVLLENYGIPGDTSAVGVARLESVLASKPKVVVLEYGHCDSWVYPPSTGPKVPIGQFEANLRTMVEKVRAAGAKPVLLTGNGVTGKQNALLSSYYEVTRKVAGEMRVPLADIAAAWAKLPDAGNVMVDDQHVNVEGQGLYVEALEKVLWGLL